MCCCFLCLNLHDEQPHQRCTLQFIRPVCFIKQCTYDFSDIRIDHDTPFCDLFRTGRFSIIDTHIRGLWIFRRHAPERVFDNNRGVVSIARHFCYKYRSARQVWLPWTCHECRFVPDQHPLIAFVP